MSSNLHQGIFSDACVVLEPPSGIVAKNRRVSGNWVDKLPAVVKKALQHVAFTNVRRTRLRMSVPKDVDAHGSKESRDGHHVEVLERQANNVHEDYRASRSASSRGPNSTRPDIRP